MKPIKTLILLAVGLALALIIITPNYTKIKEYTSSRLSENFWPNSLDQSAFFPPPLRATLGWQEGQLTPEGTLEWTNYERKLQNLLPLESNIILNQAAEKKLNDMLARQYFEHVSPTGEGPADVAQSVGYAYILVGENLALGHFASDKDLVAAWMNSPGHRANILNDRYQELGIAVKKGVFEGREQWLAVQSFGLPLSACPSVDSNLKKELTENENKITQLQTELVALKSAIDADDKRNPKSYNQKVERYNALVVEVNSLIAETKRLVERYNSQVSIFNNCLKK